MPVNSFENYPMSWKPKLKKEKGQLCTLLVEQLERDIADRVLMPGTKLPPQRELADYLDINLSTVARAFKICSQKGLLSGSVGRGTYVAYDVATRISAQVSEKEEKPIELGVMMPEAVPQEEIHILLKEIMEDSNYGRFFQYSIHVDDWQLEAALRLLEKTGCRTPKKQIFFASGAQNALAAVFAGVFRPGDCIGVDPLVYPGLKSVAALFGIKLVSIMQKDGEMTEKGIRHAAKNSKIKALYVMPDCHNPTTHIMSVSCREMLAHVARELDLLVIEDSMDRLILTKTYRTVFSMAPERTIYILSFSKVVNPALRLAYVAVSEICRMEIDNALYNLNLSQSALLLEIASRLIVSGKLEDVIEGRREGLKIRNQITDDILDGYDIRGNKYSLGRWLMLPEGISGQEFEQMAFEKGVFVYGGEILANLKKQIKL